jgi:hypothetical protein
MLGKKGGTFINGCSSRICLPSLQENDTHAGFLAVSIQYEAKNPQTSVAKACA